MVNACILFKWYILESIAKIRTQAVDQVWSNPFFVCIMIVQFIGAKSARLFSNFFGMVPDIKDFFFLFNVFSLLKRAGFVLINKSGKKTLVESNEVLKQLTSGPVKMNKGH